MTKPTPALFLPLYFLLGGGELNAQPLKQEATRGRQVQRTFHPGRAVQSPPPGKEIPVVLNDPLLHKRKDLTIIEAHKAWTRSRGNRSIVVAVIDTGVDIHHPDLKNNIWKNPREIPGNGKDDDQNGYVDDIHGWNFVRNNNQVGDEHGHGTHIAGLIGAEGGNGAGISGIAPRVSLMVLKYFSPYDDGTNNLSGTIKAIKYAVQNGAHIINYSGGGLESNKEEERAIKEAERKGILFVAAAGNESSDIKRDKYYPASYSFSNILGVSNSRTEGDKHHQSSNRDSSETKNNVISGTTPGVQLLSTLPRGRYGKMTGTSQATAIYSGAAVLIMDYYQIRSAGFVKKYLEMTGDKSPALVGQTKHGYRLNVFNSLSRLKGKEPNFKDQVVRSYCHFPYKPKNWQACEDRIPLRKDTEDLQVMNRQLSGRQKNPSTPPRAKNKKPRGQGGRDPASLSSPGKKTPVLLKRWNAD